MPNRLPADLARLLGIRDFALLWAGTAVSLFGDGIYFVAVAWEVYRLSSSPAALSIVGVAFTVPQVLLLLVGGVVSDRFDRRVVMIAGNLVSGVAVLGLGVLAAAGILSLGEIWALAAAYGISQAFFLPAASAIVPSLVPVELLPHANAVDQFVQPVALRLAGPALGGGVIALWGTGPAFLIDGGTFLAAAAALWMMAARPPGPGSDPAARSALKESAEALRFVRSQPWLWGTLLAAAVSLLCFYGPAEVLIPYLVKYQMRGGASDLGLVLAAGGVGAVLAALWVGWRGLPRRQVTWMFAAWALSTFAIAGIALALHSWQAMVLSLVCQAGFAVGTMVWMTLMGSLVPTAMLGRVSSFDWMVSISLTPVSLALTGPIAALLGARGTLLGAGCLGGVVILLFLLVPGIREPEQAGLRRPSGG